MYTFKPQAKQNAKRFLVKTCKVADEDVQDYLTQDGSGAWGCYLNDAGKPVPFQTVVDAIQAATAQTCSPADAGKKMEALAAEMDAALHVDAPVEEEPQANSPTAAAFGAFAFAQLTAEPSQAQTEQPARVPTGRKIEKDRAKQNGVTRPSAGTTCAQVWMLADHMTSTLGTCARLSAVIEAAKELNINQFTARTQYACWRKFNGITGRVTK